MRLTPDGARYLAMANGERQPMPFHLRPLLPMLCGMSELRWIVATVLSVVASVLLTGVLAIQHGADELQAVVAMLLLAGLPWVRFCVSAPVLVDMPGLAFALAAAVLWPVSIPAAAAMVALGALASEKVPVLAALFAWAPWLLVGLVVPVLVRLLFPPADVDPRDPHRTILEHPVRAGLAAHAGHWRNPQRMVMPWGACLLVLAAPTLWIGAALAAGYAQLFVATDSVRLYQTAAPVLCISAAMLIPESFIPVALVAHWFNPFMGDGV